MIRFLIVLFILQAILVKIDAQDQRYSYPHEKSQTNFIRRNKNIYQQSPYEQLPQDTLYNRHMNGKTQYQQPVYNANNRQQFHQNSAPNRSQPNGSSRSINNRHQNGIMDRNQNKCRISIPVDVIEKYPEARKVEDGQQKILITIETCCEGYQPIRWRGGILCRPICENCKNGMCIKPGECQCYEEFIKNDNDDCIFKCPLGCLNGKCYLDGTCKCDPGYKLDKTRQYCQPICSAGCGENIRHNCTEPEVCGCAKGYQLTDDGCQPVCEPECGIGGKCQDANVCECDRGYDLKDGVCQADCYQECTNGICYARNRCICKPGFTYHERSTHCVPV